MKRMVCITLVVVVVVLGLVGCQKTATINSIPAPDNTKLKWNAPKQDEKTVTAASSLAEGDGTTHRGLEIRSSEVLAREDQLWTQGHFQEKKVPQTVTVDLLGMKGTGTYQYSYYESDSFSPSRRYACEDDAEGNLRFFNIESDGRISGFRVKHDYNDIENALTVTEEKCREIATEFLKNFVTDPESYDVRINRSTDTWCTAYFRKYVDGQITFERASVRLVKDGEITSFTSCALGRISEDKVPAYSTADLIARAETILDEFYTEEEKAIRPDFHYESGCVLTMTGPDQYALICTVHCNWEGTSFSYDFLFKV